MRLTKITTKTGDKGTTRLAAGEEVYKNSKIINLIGDIDELNSYVGLLRSYLGSQNENYEDVIWIQNRLFDLGGGIASGKQIIDKEDVEFIETLIESINNSLPPLQEFILPGGEFGKQSVSIAHVCRTIARRTERSMVSYLIEKQNNNYLEDIGHGLTKTIDDEDDNYSLKFLNRLSDYFFVLARDIANGDFCLWEPKAKN